MVVTYCPILKESNFCKAGLDLQGQVDQLWRLWVYLYRWCGLCSVLYLMITCFDFLSIVILSLCLCMTFIALSWALLLRRRVGRLGLPRQRYGNWWQHCIQTALFQTTNNHACAFFESWIDDIDDDDLNWLFWCVYCQIPLASFMGRCIIGILLLH